MSGKTSSESKSKYNKKVYTSYLYTYRKNSELAQAIKEFKSRIGTSFNFIITKLLCDYFDVPFPHPEIDED